MSTKPEAALTGAVTSAQLFQDDAQKAGIRVEVVGEPELDEQRRRQMYRDLQMMVHDDGGGRGSRGLGDSSPCIASNCAAIALRSRLAGRLIDSRVQPAHRRH